MDANDCRDISPYVPYEKDIFQYSCDRKKAGWLRAGRMFLNNPNFSSGERESKRAFQWDAELRVFFDEKDYFLIFNGQKVFA
jgi:hypothetical protein